MNIYPGRSDPSKPSSSSADADNARQTCLKRVRSDNPATTTEDPLDEDANIVDDPDQTPQSVHVDADPHLIRLSSVNYDETLISYLQTHPLTKRLLASIILSIPPDLVM